MSENIESRLRLDAAEWREGDWQPGHETAALEIEAADRISSLKSREMGLAGERHALRARLADLEAAAAKGTEYVLAQINDDLRAKLSASQAECERLREALTKERGWCALPCPVTDSYLNTGDNAHARVRR